MTSYTKNLFRWTTPILFTFTSILNSNTVLAQSSNADGAKSLNAESVRRHIIELADDRYEGRGAGYPGELKAGEYIAKQFKQIGLKPVGDLVRGKHSYFQQFSFQAMHPVKPWALLTSRNIVGLIEGTDPQLKNQVIVIGAHYDGQGRLGQADPFRIMPTDPNAARDEIWNSANDNATSVAAILEMAHLMKQDKLATRRSILFIAFGAEEHGMSGSMYYVGHPLFPITDHVAMINMEKIGRSPDKPFSTSGNANSLVWDEIIKTTMELTKTRVTTANPFAVPESDHYPFNASKIPAIMFYVSGAPEGHLPSDVAEKIDFNRVAEAARFVMKMAIELADRSNRPVWVAAPVADFGLSAHLATNEESDAMGLKPPDAGLKVTGVIKDLPAAAGGLQTGDLIIKMGNIQFVRNEPLESLQKKHMDALMGKYGNKLPTTIIRNGKQEELVINLK